MRFSHILMTGVLIWLAMAVVSTAQDDEQISTFQQVTFYLLYDPLDLAFETWDDVNPSDTVKMDAFGHASGLLEGFRFHYEKTRDRLTVFRQIGVLTEEIEYLGYASEERFLRFDFVCMVPLDHYERARRGDGYPGHGVSGEENLLVAREESNQLAFEDAIRYYLKVNFTDRGETIPGIVDGRITWFVTENEGRSPESGNYVYDMTVWIELAEED